MQWLVTILVVLSALALLAIKLYRFGRELTRGDSGEDFKPRCGGCPGATKSESELGITIKPLVQIGDKTKNAGLALVVLLSCLGGIVVSQEIRPPNYDESKASGFELVSVLAGPDGKAIQSKEQWPAQRSYWSICLPPKSMALHLRRPWRFGPRCSTTARPSWVERPERIFAAGKSRYFLRETASRFESI
jgi:hypothetical protein